MDCLVDQAGYRECSEDEFFLDLFSEGDVDGAWFDIVCICRLCFAQYGQEERVGGCGVGWYVWRPGGGVGGEEQAV